jgi:hypothetical protein
VAKIFAMIVMNLVPTNRNSDFKKIKAAPERELLFNKPAFEEW